jgi:hypothetical protein
MSPKRSDLVLSTNIPYVKLCVFIRDCLHVEADSGNGCNILLELEIIEDCYGGINCQCWSVGKYDNGVWCVLVFPAASRPSISRRISFDPKILSRILDTDPPMLTVVSEAQACAYVQCAWC